MDFLLTRRVRQVVVRAGWAPLSVVGIHALAAALFGHAPELDPAMHFLGGAAAAYFLGHAVTAWEDSFGRPSPWAQRLIVFSLTTTVAVFWEFLEFSTGAALGLYSQLSLKETMGDLFFGCVGAAVLLGATTVDFLKPPNRTMLEPQ